MQFIIVTTIRTFGRIVTIIVVTVITITTITSAVWPGLAWPKPGIASHTTSTTTIIIEIVKYIMTTIAIIRKIETILVIETITIIITI